MAAMNPGPETDWLDRLLYAIWAVALVGVWWQPLVGDRVDRAWCERQTAAHESPHDQATVCPSDCDGQEIVGNSNVAHAVSRAFGVARGQD